MRLKEITHGMVIHCKNYDEKKALLEEAERLGYVWYSTKNKPTYNIDGVGCTIYFYNEGTTPLSEKYKHITHSFSTCDVTTEFSDLILPELTAEEALEICHKICNEKSCNDCLMDENCFADENSDFRKVVEICAQWKSDHHKKEPEIETVDICRIIEIQPDGRKRCVHEEDIDLPFDGYEKQKTEEILKCYCMEHDGDFIAVHEVVSRVKR